MRCPECQTELPDTARFCSECGRKIEIGCPQCGNPNPAASKFCLECGHDLRTPSAAALPKNLSSDEKLAKIQKYLPSGLAEKILSQRDKIEGERKQVTVMFCDMADFTPLVEKLGPEEAYSMMDRVYEILIHKVHDYEGTVNELTGDGIMALFGAPIAVEDVPQSGGVVRDEQHEVVARQNVPDLCQAVQTKGRSAKSKRTAFQSSRHLQGMRRGRLGDEVPEGAGKALLMAIPFSRGWNHGMPEMSD
jgi:class 3 adenylate cyclase